MAAGLTSVLARAVARVRQPPTGRTRVFATLSREFFHQLFISESAISDHQHRVAMIGVLSFLITPGLLMPLQMISMFELAYLRFPALVEPLTRLLATIFLTYAIVVVGVVAAYVWDGLGFDRRDAMVVGPLPVPGALVIGAKLAALGALLLITVTAINVMTAVPFAMIASSHKNSIAFGRHLGAHMVATTAAAVFVFSGLVTLRALLALARAGRAALESLLQFTLVSALLCFTVLTPSSLKVSFPRGVRHRVVPTVQMMPIPSWSPTNWYLGLYEVLRGTNDGQFNRAAWMALAFTAMALAAAIVTTILGYRRQLRAAVSPSATQALRSARLARLFARLLAGGSAVARACADFIVTTIARNRPQQTPIAINGAIGVALIVIRLARGRADFASLLQPSAVSLSIPFILMFWTIVGLRASFYVPTELPSSWMFLVNAPARSRAYRRAACASAIALIAPPAVFLAVLLTVSTRDWPLVGRHAALVLFAVVALAELITLTIDFLPFTRPYSPGHAKLKTRWPIYAAGAFFFALGLPRLELAALQSGNAFLTLAACFAAAIVLCEIAGRSMALRWSMQSAEELGDEEHAITVLDLVGLQSPAAR
jgi:hypothetical protein